jgi:excisionase family DNA binding protein
MAAIGDLNEYVKFQMAQGMERGAGAGAVAAEMAVGLAMAQQMGARAGGILGRVETGALLAPEEAARILSVPESDVLRIIESGELPAKHIGTSLRIRRADLDAWLSK